MVNSFRFDIKKPVTLGTIAITAWRPNLAFRGNLRDIVTAGKFLPGNRVAVNVNPEGLFIGDKMVERSQRLASDLSRHQLTSFEVEGPDFHSLRRNIESVLHYFPERTKVNLEKAGNQVELNYAGITDAVADKETAFSILSPELSETQLVVLAGSTKRVDILWKIADHLKSNPYAVAMCLNKLAQHAYEVKVIDRQKVSHTEVEHSLGDYYGYPSEVVDSEEVFHYRSNIAFYLSPEDINKANTILQNRPMVFVEAVFKKLNEELAAILRKK